MRYDKLIVASFAAIAAAACGGGEPEVHMAIAVPRGLANALSSAVTVTPGAGGLTLSDGSNTLIITSAEVVLEEIELKRSDVSQCGTQTTTPPGEDNSTDDGCEKFESGPRLVKVPLDGKVAQEIATVVPPGSYDRLEFKIHKLEGGSGSDILRDRPDFAGLSVRIAGTFNGTSFVFVSEESQEQEIDLAPPLVVDASGSDVNLTLAVDLAAWFSTAGGALIDPTVQNNADVIDNNIDRSFECFEDHDRDGRDDDAERDAS